MTPDKKMKGSQALVAALEHEGCDVMFGYPGGVAIPFYDALYDAKNLRHVLVRHEQGAAHAADGYARATGKVGVCTSTSGPGATNLVTGIATAYLDSSPLVAITWQVRSDLIGTDAFQEADITGITLPIVKHSYLVKSAAELPRVVHEAFHIASTGRPGPVVIDIPVDVALGELAYHDADTIDLPGYRPTFKGHVKQIRAAAKAINEAQRPVLYLGGGAISSDAAPEILRLAELRRVPVATTLMGLGAFPETHELSMGMLGMHGTVTANYAVHECDLLINLGARFDDRVTGKLKAFAPHAKVIHADVDPAEIGKNVEPLIPIVGDAKHVAAGLVKELEGMEWTPERTADWLARIAARKDEFPLQYEDPKDGKLAAAAGDPGDRPRHQPRRHHLHRCGPAPDVGDPVLHLPVPAPVRELGRPRHHGVRPPGEHRRQDRQPRQDGDRHQRRRRLPDDRAGAGDRGELRRPRRGLHPQQRLPGHGPPVAGPVLEQALFVHLHRGPAGLQDAGRGVRRGRHAGDREGRDRAGSARSHRLRPAHGHRLPDLGRGERVPDGAGRQRDHRDDRRPEPQGTEVMKHTLSILVENKPGVLTRVAGLFARRGFNIESLAVGLSEDTRFSRITIVIDGDEHPVDQVTKQLHKLVNVLKIRDLDPDNAVSAELLLVKVAGDGDKRSEALQIAEIFKAKIIDVDRRALTLRVVGTNDKVEALLELLQPLGVVEVVRTGTIAIGRGKG